MSTAGNIASREKFESDIARQLGSDLWSLVCSFPAAIETATPLIGDDYPGYQPKAFRLGFADGRILKGRRMETVAQAQQTEYLSRCLGYQGLPRVLARAGTALLSEWIEGLPLNASHCDAHVLRQIGALQGFTHTRPLPVAAFVPLDPIDSQRAKMKRDLDALVDLEVLDRALALKAAEIAMAHAPTRCASGFTYGDLCPGNVVLQPSGAVFVVDTETLSIQPYDYDVARTWYRWPMQRGERNAFFSGYLAHRELTDFYAYFPYWAITAIVDSASFRGRRGGVAAATVPVQRLHALVRDIERGMTAEETVFLY